MPIKFRNKEITAVVLDFDHTFYPVDEKREEEIWGPTRRELVTKLLEAQKITDYDDKRFDQEFKRYLARTAEIGWLPAFMEAGGNKEDFVAITSQVSKVEFVSYDQDLVDFLLALMAHVPVYIFTGSSRQVVLEALEILIGDLWVRFDDKLLAADDVQAGKKPEKAAYLEMIEKFGLDPGSTIYADDQLAEVTTAAGLDMITFLVGEVERADMSPHLVLPTIKELANHLEYV